MFDSIIHRVPLHRLEAGAFDHLDDLLLRHLYLIIRFDGVDVGEFAAVGEA